MKNYNCIQIMNMKLVNQKNGATPSEIQKFNEGFQKKKLNIEKKFKKSTTNKLYQFPTLSRSNSPTISSSQESIPQLYTLKSQNQVNKKNQSAFYIPPAKTLNRSVNTNFIEYNTTKSAKSLQDTTNRKTIKPLKTNRNIEISFDSRKKTTKANSRSKLLVQQYSLDNRYSSNYKSNREKGVLISFRGNKNKDISVCVSGKKMKTEIF